MKYFLKMVEVVNKDGVSTDQGKHKDKVATDYFFKFAEQNESFIFSPLKQDIQFIPLLKKNY